MSDTPDSYRTIIGLSEGVYREKGSKFLAFAIHCSTEFEVKQYLTSWQKDHHQARHLCYAYRLGIDGSVVRANDDGEPAHTAGTPILGQILSRDLTNVLVGVVRYFGGIKLGVSGLINAYKSSAADALDAAECVVKIVYVHFEIEYAYEVQAQLMNRIKKLHIGITSHRFGDTGVLEVFVDHKQRMDLGALLKDLPLCKVTTKGIY